MSLTDELIKIVNLMALLNKPTSSQTQKTNKAGAKLFPSLETLGALSGLKLFNTLKVSEQKFWGDVDSDPFGFCQATAADGQNPDIVFSESSTLAARLKSNQIQEIYFIRISNSQLLSDKNFDCGIPSFQENQENIASLILNGERIFSMTNAQDSPKHYTLSLPPENLNPKSLQGLYNLIQIAKALDQRGTCIFVGGNETVLPLVFALSLFKQCNIKKLFATDDVDLKLGNFIKDNYKNYFSASEIKQAVETVKCMQLYVSAQEAMAVLINIMSKNPRQLHEADKNTIALVDKSHLQQLQILLTSALPSYSLEYWNNSEQYEKLHQLLECFAETARMVRDASTAMGCRTKIGLPIIHQTVLTLFNTLKIFNKQGILPEFKKQAPIQASIPMEIDEEMVGEKRSRSEQYPQEVFSSPKKMTKLQAQPQSQSSSSSSAPSMTSKVQQNSKLVSSLLSNINHFQVDGYPKKQALDLNSLEKINSDAHFKKNISLSNTVKVGSRPVKKDTFGLTYVEATELNQMPGFSKIATAAAPAYFIHVYNMEQPTIFFPGKREVVQTAGKIAFVSDVQYQKFTVEKTHSHLVAIKESDLNPNTLLGLKNLEALAEAFKDKGPCVFINDNFSRPFALALSLFTDRENSKFFENSDIAEIITNKYRPLYGAFEINWAVKIAQLMFAYTKLQETIAYLSEFSTIMDSANPYMGLSKDDQIVMAGANQFYLQELKKLFRPLSPGEDEIERWNNSERYEKLEELIILFDRADKACRNNFILAGQADPGKSSILDAMEQLWKLLVLFNKEGVLPNFKKIERIEQNDSTQNTAMADDGEDESDSDSDSDSDNNSSSSVNFDSHYQRLPKMPSNSSVEIAGHSLRSTPGRIKRLEEETRLSPVVSAEESPESTLFGSSSGSYSSKCSASPILTVPVFLGEAAKSSPSFIASKLPNTNHSASSRALAPLSSPSNVKRPPSASKPSKTMPSPIRPTTVTNQNTAPLPSIDPSKLPPPLFGNVHASSTKEITNRLQQQSVSATVLPGAPPPPPLPAASSTQVGQRVLRNTPERQKRVVTSRPSFLSDIGNSQSLKKVVHSNGASPRKATVLEAQKREGEDAKKSNDPFVQVRALILARRDPVASDSERDDSGSDWSDEENSSFSSSPGN